MGSTAPYRRLADFAARLRIRRIVLAPRAREQSCAPRTNAAKILRSTNVTDVDPNWAPPAFIGTSWSLIETRQEGEFLSGVLVNPRGGVQPGRAFVIANEWDCG